MRNYHLNLKELCCQIVRVSETPCFSLLCVLPSTDTLGLTAGPLQPEPKETYCFVVRGISLLQLLTQSCSQQKEVTAKVFSFIIVAVVVEIHEVRIFL